VHFPLPKPLHGWRHLAGEVGIIVLGVLIALDAQQLAQNVQQRSEANEARRAACIAGALASRGRNITGRKRRKP